MTILKEMMPWRLKIVAKIILSRLPISYTFWQNLGLFRHGRMDDASYSINLFDTHVKRAGLQGQLKDKIILELGPGDSVATAIIAYCYGARAVLVDAGSFTKINPQVYTTLIRDLESIGLRPPAIEHCDSLASLLTACGAKYLMNGLESLAEIADDSVDLIFSQAVLEHVRRSEFLATQNECARILRANGICTHEIDLRDHLSGGLNNLRFSESVWESEFFASSGFYTNRIQFHDMNALFERAGFKVEVTEVRRWEKLPIKRSQIAAKFRNTPDLVLNISVFDVLLRLSVC